MDDIFLVAGRICPQGAYRSLIAEAEVTAILLALRLPSVARSKLPALETLFMRCVSWTPVVLDLTRMFVFSELNYRRSALLPRAALLFPSYATPTIDIELPHMPTELFFHLQAVVFAHEVRPRASPWLPDALAFKPLIHPLLRVSPRRRRETRRTCCWR